MSLLQAQQYQMTNMEAISANTRATLLLCGRFGDRNSEIRPLNQSEFHELNSALKMNRLTPINILGMSATELSKLGINHGISVKRIHTLISRESELKQAISVWGEAGIWVISEHDKQYPRRLHQHLTSARPPLLFGAGVMNNLDMGGVCIVGSRASREPGLRFSSSLGRRCALEGLTVISNDMRGVDREAVSAAIEASGKAIMVLADRLEKVVKAKRYREALSEKKLTMITPFSPNAAFSVANAIRVNRYQYVLSDVAVIVETRRKGGVWTGADENRIEKWVPAFIRADQPISPGNSALLHLGLKAISQKDVDTIKSLSDFFINHATTSRVNSEQNISENNNLRLPVNFYSLFLSELQNFTESYAKSETEIMEYFDLEKAQIRKWLNRAKIEGYLEKIAGKSLYIIKKKS